MTTPVLTPEIVLTEAELTECIEQVEPAAPLRVQAVPAATHGSVLDGLVSSKSLLVVLNRVLLAVEIYAVASSMFIYALATAFNINLYGWGALHAAGANIVFVVYFTTIMLPFALMLAWFYRYKQYLPYQKRVLELSVPAHEAFELGLDAVLSLSGTDLISADEDAGSLLCVAPGRQKAAPQEIKVQVQPVSESKTRLIISSEPMLNAIEHLLFGFTLAVDGGRNKANVDKMTAFLKTESVKLISGIS